MGQRRTWIWILSVGVAAALGWTAAMVVNAGAPLADTDDAYVRFGNALKTVDSLERTESLLKLTKQLTPETLPGAARAFEEDLNPLADSDIRFLMSYWSKQNPREMVAIVQRWKNQRAAGLAATEAIAVIAQTEGYDEARRFYDKLPLYQREAGLVSMVILFVDYGDMKDLAGTITSFADHNERDIVAHVAVERMIDSYGPKVVEDWIESLPDGRGNSSDVKRVAFRAGQRAHLDNGYLDEFNDWLQRVGDEPWVKGAWRAVAVNLVRTNPAQAIAWARALPDGEGRYDRDMVIQEAIRAWAARDSDAALAWILKQEPNPELDRGTGRLVIYNALRNPELSLQLLERIVTAEPFSNARRTIAAQWDNLPAPRRDELLAQAKEIAQARAKRKRSEE